MAALHHLDPIRGLIEESLVIFRRFDAKSEIAFSLQKLSFAATSYDESKRLVEESLAIHRELGDRRGIANTLERLGLEALFAADYEEAERLCQESLAFYREISHPGGISENLSILGWCAHYQEKYSEAEELHKQHLAFAIEAENHWHIMEARFGLGLAQWALGKRVEAAPLLQEGLIRAKAINIRAIPAILDVLADLAVMFAECDEENRAVEILSLAIHQLDWPLAPEVKARAQRFLASLGAEMPTGDFLAAVARGKTLELETAVEWVMSALQTLQNAAPSPQIAILSAREMEVLRLVAEGLSNREIAKRLVLSVSTVKWYINEIFSKLYVTNRTQAVAQARSRGLLP
jgi:DNA-binding NarL/FixJ family response regulator